MLRVIAVLAVFAFALPAMGRKMTAREARHLSWESYLATPALMARAGWPASTTMAPWMASSKFKAQARHVTAPRQLAL